MLTARLTTYAAQQEVQISHKIQNNSCAINTTAALALTTIITDIATTAAYGLCLSGAT